MQGSGACDVLSVPVSDTRGQRMSCDETDASGHAEPREHAPPHHGSLEVDGEWDAATATATADRFDDGEGSPDTDAAHAQSPEQTLYPAARVKWRPVMVEDDDLGGEGGLADRSPSGVQSAPLDARDSSMMTSFIGRGAFESIPEGKGEGEGMLDGDRFGVREGGEGGQDALAPLRRRLLEQVGGRTGGQTGGRTGRHVSSLDVHVCVSLLEVHVCTRCRAESIFSSRARA